MFISVVYRYQRRRVVEYEQLSDAAADCASEQHFFVGVIEPETGKVWLPRGRAIGYSQSEALETLANAASIPLKKLILEHNSLEAELGDGSL
jgi:hypothetical protein